MHTQKKIAEIVVYTKSFVIVNLVICYINKIFPITYNYAANIVEYRKFVGFIL